MAPRDVVTVDGMAWLIIDLPERCGNLSCSNEPGEGRFVLLIEQGPKPPAVPAMMFVCAPCAAILRGEHR